MLEKAVHGVVGTSAVRDYVLYLEYRGDLEVTLRFHNDHVSKAYRRVCGWA